MRINEVVAPVFERFWASLTSIKQHTVRQKPNAGCVIPGGGAMNPSTRLL